MLPGFRFLFAAILLSTSILVFGVGAAALLRATHEQAVGTPSWRTGPQEQAFAQAPPPMLAVLRVEPMPAAEAPALRDEVPTIGLPDSGPEQQAGLTFKASPPAEPQIAEPASLPAGAAPIEVPEAEPVTSVASDVPAAPAPDSTAEAAAPAAEDPPALSASSVSEPSAVETTASTAPDVAPTIVSTPQPAASAAASDAAPAKAAAPSEPVAPGVKEAPTKAKADGAPDSKATQPRAKAKKRHRVVRRPPPQPVQPSFDPFAQPQPAFAATTTTRTRR
jgi:hypothetical protein